MLVKNLKKYFGKLLLAPGPNFNISPWIFGRKFSPLAFINRRTPAAFRYENMTSSLLLLTHALRGFQISIFIRWHGSVGSTRWSKHQTEVPLNGPLAQLVGQGKRTVVPAFHQKHLGFNPVNFRRHPLASRAAAAVRH